VSCTCDQSYTCSECQQKIDLELDKQENVKFREESRERMNNIDDRLATIEAMLAEYLAAQPKKGSTI